MLRSVIDRRELLKQGFASLLGTAAGAGLLTSCQSPSPPPACEPSSDDPAIGWGPSVLAPVFYGYADYGPGVGAPANLRVYYPSLDGAPKCAPFLTGPGHFPLVLFLHGQCSASELHYTRWSRLPAGLARAGFVVAIPDLTGIGYPWEFSNSIYTRIDNVLYWMRTGWSHRAYLMAPPILGIVGHSYGALHGARLALTLPATVYVSVGGVWSEWPGNPPNPLNSLTIPKLVAHGTGIGAFAESINFGAVPSPKHRLRFSDSGHWDYVPPEATGCDEADPGSVAGSCGLVDDLVADFAAVYLSKYMPPEEAGFLPGFIPDTLVPPPVSLTTEQSFFAGGHLASFAIVGSRPECSGIDLEWVTPSGTGSRMMS